MSSERLALQAGQWVDPKSAEVRTHQSVMHEMAKKRVVLLGEQHDRHDIHRWQLNVSASLLALRDELAVGFEMFPRRIQPVLDEWVAGKLEAEQFLEKAEWGKVWGFDANLYWPLFHFCREFNVKMLALNCRRDLVTRVGKEGWEAIAEEDRDGLTPARPASLAHREHLLRLTNGGPPIMQESLPTHLSLTALFVRSKPGIGPLPATSRHISKKSQKRLSLGSLGVGIWNMASAHPISLMIWVSIT